MAETIEKVPCKSCEAKILHSTFQKTKGFCMPCHKKNIRNRHEYIFLFFMSLFGIAYYVSGTILLGRLKDFAFSQVSLAISALIAISLILIIASIDRKRMWLMRVSNPNPDVFIERHIHFVLYKVYILTFMLALSAGITVILFKIFPTVSTLPNIVTVLLGVFGSIVAVFSVWRML